MDLLHRVITKHHQIIEKKYIKTIKRRQCNLTMAKDIIAGVKIVAAILEVPQYVAYEHILQVGIYQLLKAINDPVERQKLKEHLVNVHLLGDELKDDDVLLPSSQD